MIDTACIVCKGECITVHVDASAMFMTCRSAVENKEVRGVRALRLVRLWLNSPSLSRGLMHVQCVICEPLSTQECMRCLCGSPYMITSIIACFTLRALHCMRYTACVAMHVLYTCATYAWFPVHRSWHVVRRLHKRCVCIMYVCIMYICITG
jgi:hypothetical protein